jgi:hypothetical protein
VTRDQAVARAGAQLDRLATAGIDASAFRMIAAGLDVEAVDDFVADAWRDYAVWRVGALAQIQGVLEGRVLTAPA